MEQTITEQKPSIKLNRGMNGNYGWEIKAYGELDAELVELISEINESLDSEYGHPKDKEKD